MALTRIEAYLVHSNSKATGRHWDTVFDKYGQIIYSVHCGNVCKSPLFFSDPTVTHRPRITTEDIRGKDVFEQDNLEVVFVAEPPPDIDPEFEEVLKASLYRP